MTEQIPKWKKHSPSVEKYTKKTIRRYAIKINRNTDPDILEKLESTDNIQGYIKELIRADIAQSKKDPE